jgi:hypothetical protein
MSHKNLLPLVVGCALGSAALATLVADEGWFLWVPVAVALIALAKLRARTRP